MSEGRDAMAALRRLGRRRGSFVVIAAVLMSVLMTLSGMVIDLGDHYVMRTRLRTAADAAAIAAAQVLPNAGAARERAIQIVTANMPPERFGNVLLASNIDLGTWNAKTRSFTVSESEPNAVRLVTRRAAANGNAMPMLFGRLLGRGPIDLGETAIAVRELGSKEIPWRPEACIYLLAPKQKEALEAKGRARVEMPDCNIQVHSTHKEALDVHDHTHLIAKSICVAGGAKIHNGGNVSPAPQLRCSPKRDPFAAFVPPPVGGCTFTKFEVKGGRATLKPGVYCGGIEAKDGAEITLTPGIYVMRNGDFKSTGGGSITGEGVVIALSGKGSRIDVTGGGTLALSAPRSGPFSGFVIYQYADAKAEEKSVLSGDGSATYRGIVYAPKQNLKWKRSVDVTSTSYMILVADSLELSGDGTFRLNNDYENADFPFPPLVTATEASVLLVK